MRKFDKLKTLSFILVFALCVLTVLVQRPLFAANQYQAADATEPTTYIVQAGDTLSAIARRFDTTVAALIELNNLANANVIYVGQTLVIRAPEAPPHPRVNCTGGDGYNGTYTNGRRHRHRSRDAGGYGHGDRDSYAGDQ